MKRIIAVLLFLPSLLLAVPYQAPQTQMTCTGAIDCPLKIQYETDLQTLQAAQQAVQADLLNYQQQVTIPAEQATLTNQIAIDSATLNASRTIGVVTSTPVTTTTTTTLP